MRMRLRAATALITGAQQGIGRGIALALAREGAAVAINYLDEAAGTAAAAAARHEGARAVALPGDVSSPAGCARLVEEAAQALGGLDVLVNNAGMFPRVPMLDMTEGDWDFVIDINLKGAFFCAQAAARIMLGAGRPGAIINLASQAIRGAPRGVHYSASKGGVVAMTRAMALELAPHRIRVNAIAPGLTDTAQPRYGHSEEELSAMARAVPLGRMATVEDIGAAAVFLASPESGHVTGQTIHVNGGSYMP